MTNKANALTASNIEKLNQICADSRVRNFHIKFYSNRVKLVVLGRKIALSISMPTIEQCITRMNERLSIN